MKFKAPKNSNYCATVVTIKSIVDLENCDNVKGSFIFGGQVIVSKETSVGDVGVYFPPETQLSTEFLSNNNLYRDKTLNKDQEKNGYFENNGRVRTVKFRGNKSVGFWIPINCLEFTGFSLTEFKEGDEFDEINNTSICKKYVRQRNPLPKVNNARSRRRVRRQTKSKVIDNQFRFHEDTNQLAKNINRIHENSLISITYKLHGTSLVVSKVLCNKNLNPFSSVIDKINTYPFFDRVLDFLDSSYLIYMIKNKVASAFSIIPKILKKFIISTEYSNLYASRKVIKNGLFSSKFNSYYKVDIWGKANDKLKEFLEDGMTIYAEIVGYVEDGAYIQKPFDYGCEEGKFEVYIYRITYTNPAGRVFEFSAKQVRDWCKERGLNPVPELYYGLAIDLFERLWVSNHGENPSHEDKNKKIMTKYGCKEWNADLFLKLLQEVYLEEDCVMCKNKVPAEGVVVRIEKNDFEAYKLKSTRFLEHETKMLDKGEEDIEERQGDDQNREEG